VLSTLSPRGAEAQGAAGQWSCDAATGAWVLEPLSLPVAVVHFLGGAGFGTYPRVAYAELVERLSLACGGGVAVVCTPYDVALDHGALAANSLKAFEAARLSENHRIIEWARHLGAFLQATKTQEEQARAGKHSTDAAVIEETATLDFLYA